MISSIGDEALVSIGVGCPSLQHLNVSGCHQIGDAGIMAIARGCPQLSSLDISVLQVDDLTLISPTFMQTYLLWCCCGREYSQ